MTTEAPAPSIPADLALIANWMLAQRWYANKGALAMLEEIGQWELPSPDPQARFVVHLLLDHTPGTQALYQVPLAYRDHEPLGVPTIGRSPIGWIADAAQDPAFGAALLDFMEAATETRGWRTWAIGSSPRSPGAGAVRRSRVLGGEQSNTSIIVERDGAPPVICKVFRAIHDGENPDVVLQGALSAAGSAAVPQAMGHVMAEWPDRGEATGRARGHLVVAQEFLPGARDGWIVALESARAGESFARRAHQLGVVTAGVHATLAATLPTEPMTNRAIDDAIAAMHERLRAAIAAVPSVAAHEAALARLVETARTCSWPAQQRVHGDLHLGQVLDAGDRGWVVVDFEGEPLRPMRERSRLDNPLRDVAGMLRSFDYVAGSLAITAGIDARAWADEARTSFASGYAAASGLDLALAASLLTALEADKALYEAVYEARNRPTWLTIPVEALTRLATRSGTRD